MNLSIKTLCVILMTSCLSALPVAAQTATTTADIDKLPFKDRLEYFQSGVAAGIDGIARKSRAVDARPAVVGETVVSIIAGEGIETTSPPAAAGDWVVRNRCPETGNEEILVTAAKFPTRYGEAQTKPDADGYMEFIPTGAPMKYFIVPNADGEFAIEAPWGEKQIFRPGDAIVQVMDDPNDTYRVQKQAFACTYEVIK